MTARKYKFNLNKYFTYFCSERTQTKADKVFCQNWFSVNDLILKAGKILKYED